MRKINSVCLALLLLPAARATPAPPMDAAPGKADALLQHLDAPLLFVRRHSYTGIHIYDTFYKWPPGGGGIYVLENPSAPRSAWKIRPVIDESTEASLGRGVYSQPELSWDAKKLLFCFKGEPRGSTSIYEIGLDGAGLRRITDPSLHLACYAGAHAGQHDVDPSYLPDGRVIFTSTRPSGLVPCANSGVAILHVMNRDGSDIHPISVNSETEFDPAVLPDGRIIFGRWEYVDKNALTVQSLWTIDPDGSNETAVFANNMVFPEAILDVRPVPGSHLVAATLARHNHTPRGTIAMIDPRVGKNDPEAIFNFEHPENPTYDLGDSCEPFPLDSDTVLFSARPEGYGHNIIQIISRGGERTTVLTDPDISLHSPMLVKPRPVPARRPDLVDRTGKRGAFYVQDVYAGLEGIERGEARWLRVIEETSRISASPLSPNPYNQTFLVSAALAFATKIYHGVVPIQEDGSVYFEAPSGRALYFQVLDKDKRLIQSMRTFVQAAPGRVRACIGCHEAKSSAPSYAAPATPGILDREAAYPEPESWGTGYMDYPSMIQPIWDRHCVACHGGKKGIEGRLDLSGGWTEHFNISYENLVDRLETQLVAHWISGIDCMNGTAHWSCRLNEPRSHGSGVAPLAHVIMSGHEGRIENLTDRERDLVMAWIDSNGLYYGSWDYTAHGYTLRCWQGIRDKLAARMRDAGCLTCHDSYLANDWINLQNPEFSRILRAPLAKGENGYGLARCRNHKVDPRRNRIRLLRDGYAHSVRPISHFARQPMPPLQEGGKAESTFASPDDAHYQAMLEIIRRGRLEALSTPRVDMPGADPTAGECRMFNPPPVPETSPPLEAAVGRDGVVFLSWERSADTIGLSSELHRGSTANFTPGRETLLANTRLFRYSDRDAPEGEHHYALTLASGTHRSGPSRLTVRVPRPLPPAVPTALQAAPEAGEIRLAWRASDEPGVRYHVHRLEPDGDAYTRITTSPIVQPSYTDAELEPKVRHTYYVTAVSRREIDSAPSSRVAAAALPEIMEPVFTAELHENTGALIREGGEAGGELHAQAKVSEGSLDLQQGGHLTYEHRPEFDLGRRISVAIRVKITQDTRMPVIVSCGHWNRAGWFLQRIGDGWRWHVGGIDCDGGVPAVNRWTELAATFDGRTARLFQDGRLVAEEAGSAIRTPWPGPLHVGQYSGGPGPQYQVLGLLSELRIYSRALRNAEIMQ